MSNLKLPTSEELKAICQKTTDLYNKELNKACESIIKSFVENMNQDPFANEWSTKYCLHGILEKDHLRKEEDFETILNEQNPDYSFEVYNNFSLSQDFHDKTTSKKLSIIVRIKE